MLEKLHDKFEDERTDLEKEESNARHACAVGVLLARRLERKNVNDNVHFT